MKANELRIGNYLEKKFLPKRIEVSGFLDDFVIDEDENEIGLNEVSPILLSEEWLVKFGFDIERNPEEVIYTKSFDVLDIYKIEIKRKVGYDIFYFKTDDLHKQVLKIHQLQNLYFALTGEELTIRTK